jgi:GNAT superfamily N-acetyltransferase
VRKDHILIRNFELNDISSLSSLTNELGYPTTVEEMETRMKTILQLENYWTFVAILDDIVVGYIGLIKNYFWEQNGHFIRVQALVVSKEFRRHQIGKNLIEYTEKFAKSLGSNLLILNCGNKPERESAHQFYPKMGFIAKSVGYVKPLEKEM